MSGLTLEIEWVDRPASDEPVEDVAAAAEPTPEAAKPAKKATEKKASETTVEVAAQ